MARKFLYLVAALVVLVVLGLGAYRLWAPDLMRVALVPHGPFKAPPALSPAAWASTGPWLAHPGQAEDPTRRDPQKRPAPGPRPPRGQIFYLGDTSYVSAAHWNAPRDDAQANLQAEGFVGMNASAFAPIGPVWAPRIAQATFGAFVTDRPERVQAFDAAYADVVAAFQAFLAGASKDPIVLAGHGQGSFHLLRLWRERIAGTPLARRIVAVYALGWPVPAQGVEGLPPCDTPDRTGCVLSWHSYAEPVENALDARIRRAAAGPGTALPGAPALCTNPLNGSPGRASLPPGANPGSVVPDGNLGTLTFHQGLVGARCSEKGELRIGVPPKGYMAYVLPGNDYQAYDYALFWAAVRDDAAHRMIAWEKSR